MEFKGFVGGSYETQAVTADSERTVNWIYEAMESQGATTRAALYPTPGVELVSADSFTLDDSPGRAHYFLGTREFAVIGASFFEVSELGVLTLRGTVAIDTDPATICSNGDGGNELFITSGGNGYVYDLLTDTLTLIAFLVGKASMGDYLSGYFIALDRNTSTFYVSNLFDGTTWDPTQFAQRTIAPDPWYSLKVVGRYIWLLGQQTSEVWFNNGGFPFPFAPHPSGLVKYGIAAPYSAVVLDDAIIWLGASKFGDADVYRAEGFVPNMISTYPIATKIDAYPKASVANAVGDSYSDQGHSFYILSFDEELITWVWDSETKFWAERGTWITEDGRYESWRPRWHAFAYGEHRMLDRNSGKVYRMAGDLFMDVDERLIRRLRRAPGLLAENRRVYYASFELDLEPGLGLANGQGSNPQVMLRMSRDGGKTWGPETWRSAGAIGEYSQRVRWNRCGMARRAVFEIAVTDPIPWRITAAYVEAQMAGVSSSAKIEESA